LASNNVRHNSKEETVKCPKCGLVSRSGTKYCPNCGVKFDLHHPISDRSLPSLAFLHFTGSAYLIITAIVNPLVQASLLFLIPYIVVGILSLFVGSQFYTGKMIKGWTKSLSMLVIIVGVIITIVIYVLGFRLERLIGPAWVIFVFNGWALIKNWRSL
jgi:hypothetical protein